MDSVSIFSYYFNLIVSYVNYFVAYYSDKFRDYPFEVKTAIWVIQWIITGQRSHLNNFHELDFNFFCV